MNFFFSIKTDDLSSKLTIPRFRNKSATNKEYEIFSSQIKNKKWFVEKLDCDIGEDFYFLSGDILDNNKIFFLAKESEINLYNETNFDRLINLNNFSDTVPDFRANLSIYNKQGGFSSYQSDYPFGMVHKRGNIISPISVLTNINAQKNYIFFRNIFIEPIEIEFQIYFIDIMKKKILFKESVYTNRTNIINIEKKYINSHTYLFSNKYLGVPMFVSCLNGHISFEHTHPPQEYIFSKSKFRIIGELKEEFNEIIDKENC